MHVDIKILVSSTDHFDRVVNHQKYSYWFRFYEQLSDYNNLVRYKVSFRVPSVDGFPKLKFYDGATLDLDEIVKALNVIK